MTATTLFLLIVAGAFAAQLLYDLIGFQVALWVRNTLRSVRDVTFSKKDRKNKYF